MSWQYHVQHNKCYATFSCIMVWKPMTHFKRHDYGTHPMCAPVKVQSFPNAFWNEIILDMEFSQFMFLAEEIVAYRQSQYSKTWDSKCLALIAQRLEHSASIWRLNRVPLRSRHSLSQKLWHFRRTSVRVSKIDIVTSAELTFQI